MVVHGGSVVVDIAIIVGIIVVIGDDADVALMEHPHTHTCIVFTTGSVSCAHCLINVQT